MPNLLNRYPRENYIAERFIEFYTERMCACFRPNPLITHVPAYKSHSGASHLRRWMELCVVKLRINRRRPWKFVGSKGTIISIYRFELGRRFSLFSTKTQRMTGSHMCIIMWSEIDNVGYKILTWWLHQMHWACHGMLMWDLEQTPISSLFLFCL